MHAHTHAHTHDRVAEKEKKKDRKAKEPFEFLAFLYLRFLLAFSFLRRIVGASAEWGGDFMGGPLPLLARS